MLFPNKHGGIQQGHADDDRYDSRSVQDVFVMEKLFTSLGLEYHRACGTIYKCKNGR